MLYTWGNWGDSVDGRISHQLISSFSHYLQGLYIPGGCLGFHQQFHPEISGVKTIATLRPYNRQGVLTISRPEVMIFHAWPSDSPGGRGEKGKGRAVLMERVTWDAASCN